MTLLLSSAFGLLFQSTILLLLGLLAVCLARRRGPAVQTLVGRAALAGVGLALLLIAPLTGHIQPLWHVTIPVAETGGPMKSRTSSRSDTALPVIILTPPTLPKGQTSSAAPLPAGVLPPAGMSRPLQYRLGLALTAIWGAGTTLLLLWLSVCQYYLIRLRRQAHPVTSGSTDLNLSSLTPHPPALFVHPSVRSPFLVGLSHPAIFLPDAFERDFESSARRAILAHELAHLARRDNAWTLGFRLLCALLWPQPLLWVLCRRLEQIGEEACDLAVLAQNCPARVYANCLLTLAERHPLGRRERALSAGVAPFRSSLGHRVQRILDKGNHSMPTVSHSLRLTVAALAFATALGGAFLVPSAPAQSANSTLALTHNGKSSLVGVWLCHNADGTGTVNIFSANGNYEEVGQWPGNREQISHSYGHYAADGQKLKYILTRVWVEGQKPWRTDPEKHVMDYRLSGDVLTLRLKGNWVNVNYRVPAYAKAMIGIKPSAASEDKPSAASDRQLSEARFLAGLTPVQGPGVVVTLNDSKKALAGRLPPGLTPPNLIHDTDINQVVNELKAAGVEAIAVNDQRLVAVSPIRCAGPTIFINNVPQAPPFVIKAIGDPKAMAAALNRRGSIASEIKYFDPAMVSVNEAGTLKLPEYSGVNELRYAKPSAPGR